MTIKVCHDKTIDNLLKCGKVVSKLLQIFFLSWIPIGIYLVFIGFDNYLSFITLLFGILVTFLFIPIMRIESGEYETILHDINKKLKLFAWNEDC